MAVIDDILSGYEALRPDQEAFYQDLHRHPELSHQEHHTARRVGDRLHGDGFAVTSGIGGTGVVGVLANGSGPAVLLRCELDALPLREESGAPYASTATATDASGHQVPVDHACGHDLHMACMTGMAKLMADHRDRWNGTLITLFQPAEETGEGAQDMVDDGLFKRIPVPDIALAQHLLPGIAGTVRTRSGPFMSAADSLKVTVYGRGGHGASPQNTVDPVVLAAMIIVRFADRRVPRRRARRHRGGDRGQLPGRHQEQRHPRLRRPGTQRAQLLQRDPAAHAGRDRADRPRRVPGQRLT
jgi:hippurate hydrolase